MGWQRWAHTATAPLAQGLWRWLRFAGTVGPEDRVGRRFGHLGPGAMLAFPQGDLVGVEHMSIGAGTIVAPHVTLSVGMAEGQPLLDGATSPVLRVGARCILGRGSHVVAHRAVVVGDDVITGPYCYVTDQNHVYADPEVPIARQWPTATPVEIGAGSWLGAGAVVLPGTRLGRNTVVAAGSVVRGEHPDHVVLAGAPATVVRRWTPGEGWQPRLPDLGITPPDDWPTTAG
mgnify:CR=1 FL=1